MFMAQSREVMETFEEPFRVLARVVEVHDYVLSTILSGVRLVVLSVRAACARRTPPPGTGDAAA